MGTVVINFEGNADSLIEALKSVTLESTLAGDAVETTGKKAADAGKKVDKAGDKAAKTNEKIEGLKLAAQAAGGRIGEMAGRAELAGKAIASFASNPVTLAIAAVAALSLAAVASGAAVAGAFVGIQRAAEDALDSIEGLTDLGVSDQEIESVKQAGYALDAIASVIDALVVKMAAEFSPELIKVATLITALGYTGIDAFNVIIKSVDGVRHTIINMIESAINPLYQRFVVLTENVAALAYLLGVDGADQLMKFAETLKENQIAAHLYDGSLSLLEFTMADNIAKAEDLIEQHWRLAVAKEEEKKKTDALRDAEKQLAEQQKQANSINAARVREQERLAKVREANHKAAMKQLEELQKKNKEFFDAAVQGALNFATSATAYEQAVERIGAALDSVATISSTVSGLASAMGDAFLTFGKDADKAARMAFAANKAAGIADAIVKTAQSIMAALTIPPPVGPILAGVNAATGALQIATIAATTFDGGGPTPRGPSGGGAGAGGQAATPAPMVKAASTDRGPGYRGGAVYRHRDLDIVAADGGYPGSAFDLAPARTGQRRMRD